MNANDIIDQFYLSLLSPDLKFSHKAEIYYNIIYTKNAESISDIYLDTKEFLKNYIQSVDEKSFGYDHLDKTKVVATVKLLTSEQQVFIWRYLKKLCNRYQCDDEWINFEVQYYKAKNNLLTQRDFWWLNPITLFYFLYFRTINSYGFLLSFLFIIFLIETIVLLPNPFNWWPSLFKVEYERIESQFWNNHLANVALNLFEFETAFKVIPVNLIGVLVLLLSKLIKVLFIVKYIIDKLINKINIDE